MTLLTYQVFKTVADIGSFHKAADILGLTPSAVSHTITNMEKELGFTVLSRSKSGISLTNYGEKILPYINAVLNSDESLQQMINDMNGLHTGRVKIGVFSSVCTSWLPDIMDSFRQKYENISIEVYQGTYDDVADWIKTGVVDLGFLSLSSAGDIPIEPLYRDPLLCVLPKGMGKNDSSEYMKVEDMQHMSFVTQRESTDADIQNFLRENNLKIQSKYHVVDDLSTIRLVEKGFGICLMPELVMHDIPYEVVECKEHRNLAVEAAHKGMVLLKNDGILPLDKRKIRTIGVVGPNANNRIALQGNYHGTSSRYVTVLEGIQKEVEDDCRVYYAEGSHMYKDTMENLAWKDDRISEAVITAKQCDVTIVVLGLDELMEGEEPDQSNRGQAGDKASLEFPGCQQRLLKAVTAVGKPVITVVLSGSAMDLRYADAHTNAILQAWYPGAEGGTAVADVLFGRVSPSGKLPVTFYKDTSDLPEFTDYSMKNRTYRYMEQEALYPFGFGLTYGNVKVSAAEFAEQPEKEKSVKIRCTVTNTGKWDTEEVVQVYIKDWKSKYAVRNHSLCGFRRVRVKAGESIETELTIDPRAFTIVDEEGKRYVDSNKFSLYVATTQPDARSTALTGHEAVELRVVFA